MEHRCQVSTIRATSREARPSTQSGEPLMRRIAIAAAVTALSLGSFAAPAAAEDEVACASAEVSVNGEEVVQETACLVLPL